MKYWAFISYSHADQKWADWLHRGLETYRVPRRLVGRESPDGKIPERLFPVFRDRDELRVAADLGSRINTALAEARYLVVICSPRAAKSRWVNEEITAFKKLGRQDRILALIVAGEPHASDSAGGSVDQECFPAALRFKLDATGALTSVPSEPIAADAREGKDGKYYAKLKLLAGLLNVEFDELRQRDHERRLRRARLIGGAALLLMLIFAGLATYAIIAAKRAEERKRDTQRLLTVADGDRAEDLFAKGDSAGALVFLARATEQDPDKDSAVTDRLWFALTERFWPLPISAPMDQHSQILSATLSKDERRVVTASTDGNAQVWDATSGKPVTPPLHHPQLVRRALFTPDDQNVVTICSDGIARLWDATSGQRVANWEINQHDEIRSVAFSPFGKWIATGSRNGSIRISDLPTGKLVREIHQDDVVHTLVFHPKDDTLLLSVKGSTATGWRLPDGTALFELKHEGDINSAQFTPDGMRIFTAGSDQTVRMWDATTGGAIGRPIALGGEVSRAIVSPNGERLATVAGRRLQIWNMAGLESAAFTIDFEKRITCAVFSLDNLIIFCGTETGMVRAYNLRTGEPVGEALQEGGAIVSVEPNRTGDRLLIAAANGVTQVWRAPSRVSLATPYRQNGAVTAMDLSPNDQFLLTGSNDGEGRLWDLARARPVAKELKHEGAVLCAAFSPNGKYALTGGADATARLWDVATGKSLGAPLKHAGTVVKVIFSPAGNLFATATEDGTAQFWDLPAQRKMGPAMTHGAGLNSIDFSHDGKRLLTASDDRIQVWDAGTGEPAGAPLQRTKNITCARFSPLTDRIAAGSSNGAITLWSGTAPNELTSQLQADTAVTGLAFSPDEHFLAATATDFTTETWNVAAGQPVGNLIVQTADTSKILFSPDSTRIATATEDGTVRLWQVTTGRPVTEPLRHDKAARFLAFSRDGRKLFSGSRDNTIKIWDVAAPVTSADREWLAGFARSITPAQLNPAGRLEFRSIDAEQALHLHSPPDSEGPRAIFRWFFSPVMQRALTPYGQTTMAQYLQAEAAPEASASQTTR